MPDEVIHNLLDLLGFLSNVIQDGHELIPMPMEKIHIRYIHTLRHRACFLCNAFTLVNTEVIFEYLPEMESVY